MPRLCTVSIMPGIDTGAPERTDTSSGFGPAPKRRPVRSSSQTTAAAISSSRPGGVAWPARNAAQARVVMTTAGGTFSPSACMRATDQALPPINSRPGAPSPFSPIVHSPKRIVMVARRLFVAFAPHQAQQIFVQFEPERVIALDLGVADPGDLAVLGLFEGHAQLAAVDRKARQGDCEAIERGLRPFVQFPETVDELFVVFSA